MKHDKFDEWMRKDGFVRQQDGSYSKVGTGSKAGVPHLLQKESALPRRKRKDTDRQGSKPKGGTDHPKYRVSIAFKMSDNRKRDPDGMLATVLDCLIDARGRLMDMDSFAKNRMRES